jgi:isoleucyl-tRNA synthetase
MDRLYKDLNIATQKEDFESVHVAYFPEADSAFFDKELERQMQKAQTVSSLVLSLRKKEMIKVRQPLQRVMIPVLDEQQRKEIAAVADLIKSEVNVKELELIDDASGILVKSIKPNFKVLGPRFGKDMKEIARKINEFSAEDIQKIERDGEIQVEVSGNLLTLENGDVEITSQDIEGWLVANSGNITVALDITISDDLKKEGIARELVNRIQNIRKDSGFEVTDKIDVTLQKDGTVEEAVQQNIEYIKTETLTANLDLAEEVNNGLEVSFDEVTTRLLIKKH